jgi:hypothetical protein
MGTLGMVGVGSGSWSGIHGGWGLWIYPLATFLFLKNEFTFFYIIFKIFFYKYRSHSKKYYFYF